MDVLLAFIYWPLLVLALQVLVEKVCNRTPALRFWRPTLRLAAAIWCLMPLLKKGFIDDIFPPSDAIEHEFAAREFAALLTSGRLGEALNQLAIGDTAYKSLVGLFYALTGSPEVITYTVNAAFGFWGMLALLEVLCLQSGCSKAPRAAVLCCSFLPSALLWTTANLKEGVVFWGLGMSLYWTLDRAHFGRGKPLLGLLAVLLIRPHIAVMWAAVISFGAVIKSRRYGVGLLAAAAVLVCIPAIRSLAPGIYEAIVSQGLTEAMGDRFDMLTDSNIASRHFIGAKPIPVYTGTTLILFRPWPNEVGKLSELIAGMEVWLFASIGCWSWRRPGKILQHLRDPCAITMLIGLLVFGLYFSYMYNMGLVVRQRLMAFPAMLFLYFWPMACCACVTQVADSAARLPMRPRRRTLPRPRPAGAGAAFP